MKPKNTILRIPDRLILRPIMNKINYITAILIILSLSFFSISEAVSQSSNMHDRFYVGPMNFYFLENLRTQNHLEWYSRLSYNAMQNYCGHFDFFPGDWNSTLQRDGGFFEETGSYAPFIKGVINQWHDLSRANSLILEREKILRAAYGQRSTYQAEGVGTWEGKFPAYGYAYSDYDAGHDITDNWMGETVTSKLCRAGIDKPGFMVKGLVDNCEQTNNTVVNSNNSSGMQGRLFSDIKQSDYNHRWYIKPKIRIKAEDAAAHSNDTVIVIYVKNFSNQYIDSFAIKGSCFLDTVNNSYDGRYLEMFYWLPPQYNDLSVRADFLANGKGNRNDIESKVDYQIKWLGKVDVWLDYVRVDDSWAHFLFTDTYENELNNPNNKWKFHRAIYDEVNAFKNMPGLAYFWVDECGFNNIPCIAEVNKLVKLYSGGSTSVTFIADPVAFVGNGGLRYKGSSADPDDWSVNWHTTYKELFGQGAISNQVIGQFFPQHWYTLYPHNLSLDNSPDNQSGAKRHFSKSNYADYYGEIPNTSWKGYMTYLNKLTKLMRFVSDSAKNRNLTFGAIVQINSDEGGLMGDNPGWGLREPTNEEISVNNFLAMCYGAKQIFQFSYNTNSQGSDNYGTYFNRGLTTPNPEYAARRLLNYYGQPKWQYMKELNERMMKIGNVLYPPGDTNLHLKYDRTVTVNTYNYACSGCNLPYSYISDIKSIYRSSSNNFTDDEACTYCDRTESRYWEIGFFNPPASQPDDKSRYFLVLNKRTYPEINNDGDTRLLKIRFNPSALQGFENWVLKDAVTDSVISMFSRNSAVYISAGLFLPGEGKLLKLVPQTP